MLIIDYFIQISAYRPIKKWTNSYFCDIQDPGNGKAVIVKNFKLKFFQRSGWEGGKPWTNSFSNTTRGNAFKIRLLLGFQPRWADKK